MPYKKTTWVDEVPSTTPVKYRIVDDSNGAIADSATIEVVTPVVLGTPINASNLNKLEAGLEEVSILAENVNKVLQKAYPVGCIFTTTDPTNPADIFGFGTWLAFGAGRVLVGFNSAETEFNTVEKIGGEKKHVLTEQEMPAHTHGYLQTPSWRKDNADDEPNASSYQVPASATAQTESKGGNQAHNVLQPYIVVHMFKRIA